jgi:hypothetical protein
MQVSHAASYRELVEIALRQVIKNYQAKKVPAALPRVTFGKTTPLADLIRQQGIQPVKAILDAGGNVWPEDESMDDFWRFNAQQRHEDRDAR